MQSLGVHIEYKKNINEMECIHYGEEFLLSIVFLRNTIYSYQNPNPSM